MRLASAGGVHFSGDRSISLNHFPNDQKIHFGDTFLFADPFLGLLQKSAGSSGRQFLEKKETAQAAALANPAAAQTAAAAPAPAVEKISFSSQVRPILSNNCYACHGPDSHNQTSPFRLDTEEHSRANLAKRGEPTRYGVVPGKPEESLLLQRVVTRDPHEAMPPPYAKKTALTEEGGAIFIL